MSGLEGVIYLLVQGSTLFSSQCDLVNLLQMIWILFLLGVKPESIHAFLGNIENIDEWPSARVGLPGLDVPPAYRQRVHTARTRLGIQIKSLFLALMLDPAINTVIFIYLNHGSSNGVGANEDDAFREGDFAVMASQAAAVGKRLLFVMDAYYSTTFARSEWTTLCARPPLVVCGEDEERQRRDEIERYVGFLTSAEDCGFTSAVLVSKQSELVFPDGIPEPFGEYAPGFRIQNSMFTRQLNDLLAYSLRGDRSMPLRDMPRFMNGHHNMEFGFQCTFVGSDDGLGAVALREFFPGGSIDPELVLAEMNGEKFKAILPNARMLGLDDDIGRFFGEEGGISSYGERMLVVSSDDGQVSYGPSVLLADIGDKDALRRRIVLGRAAVRQEGEWVEGSVSVPVVKIYARLCSILEERRFKPRARSVTADDCKKLGDFLKRINGPVPLESWGIVGYIANMQEACGGEDRLREVIREVVNQLAADERLNRARKSQPPSVDSEESWSNARGD
jgi:hypothetical protein